MNYVKTPTIFQMEATECGAASLSMILAYFGKFVSLEQMRIETGVSRDGCVAGNLMRAAIRNGLQCRGFRREPSALLSMQMPCIIHWNFNHFVVLEGFKHGHAFLNDPAVGRRKLTMEELDEGFTGVVLTFAITSAFQRAKKKRTTMRFIKDRLRGQYGVLFKLFYIGLLLVFPGIVLPILSQVFMDDVLGNGYTDWLVRLLVFMGLTVTLKGGLTYYRNLLLQKLQNKLSILSCNKLLHHLFRLPVGFFDQRYAGDLTDRVSDNTELNAFLTGDLAETVLNICIAVFYLVILLLYSPLLTAIGVAGIAINLGIIMASSKRLEDATMKLQIDAGKLSGVVCAGINMTGTLKASGAETAYTSRVLGYQANVTRQEQRLNRFQQAISGIPAAVDNIIDALLLLVGGLLVIRGDLTAGMLVAYNSLFDSFSGPVNSLVGFIDKTRIMKTNLRRVEDIMTYQSDVVFSEINECAHIRTKASGRLEMRDISFGYSPLKPALITDFGFRIASGETIAIVGPSGCGKSTVSRLLGGLYQPWSGQILLDDIDIRKIPREVTNASIAFVSQNITLFSGTVQDNLSMWNPAILDEDMINAAKDACIHDFIMEQPGEYQYMLEENAANLSGGQRQRMEIARALATNPTILIFDEATSALDPVVEKRIIDNIKRRGCSCVIIAHRLSAIRDCNQIIVMEHGRIVQAGKHKTLIAVDGPYRAFISNM